MSIERTVQQLQQLHEESHLSSFFTRLNRAAQNVTVVSGGVTAGSGIAFLFTLDHYVSPGVSAAAIIAGGIVYASGRLWRGDLPPKEEEQLKEV